MRQPVKEQQAAAPRGAGGLSSRWVQLAIGVICMGLVANLQYAWTLFVEPMNAQHHWGLASIQTAFSIFIVTETWLVPIEGWLVDRFGPRPVVIGGAICAGLGWILDALAPNLGVLYVAAVISGIGAGCVYGTCVGNALKWFPDRRGLAAGMTAAGFGAGAALTVIPIASMIARSGYQHTLIFFGCLQGGVILLLATMLVRPKPPEFARNVKRIVATKIDYTTGEMVRAPVFWVLYAMFVCVATGGIIATAQIGPIAKEYGFADMPMAFFASTLPLLTLTLSINNVCNGFTRPICGAISDRIGRENTMFITFLGEGLALLGLMHFGHNPYLFIVFSGLIFVFYGDIFSNFPATCADTFGAKYAAGNAGTLYTAKGTAALLVPIASVLSEHGGWNTVFIFAACIAIAGSVSAKFLLAPMRKRWIENSAKESERLAFRGTYDPAPLGSNE
ncbi:OFA family oxalate/formate antiporter-like MFS transporter [Paraburkholderia rhizosphaerae]|uniref:OFA family oxalate/formate antiporter-like MFS transporter n=1 Tax=Paraburkholderia rhizosphaerae TaxID=480658 RepID=A0A4R8LYV2_9BURK|nr:OFA family oxalate/formate antiporter-like MFS transporter [Paraburkholderia rhizosphaerae]